MRASGKDPCFARILFEQRAGFSDRRWLEVVEVSHEIKNISRQDAKTLSKENKISFPNLAPFAPLRE
jgi:hypothetical protein